MQVKASPRFSSATSLTGKRKGWVKIEEEFITSALLILLSHPLQVVTAEQGQALADELGLRYVETSAKANTQVEDAFFTLARDVKARLIDTAAGSGSTAPGSGATGSGSAGIDVGTNAGAKGNSSCCT